MKDLHQAQPVLEIGDQSQTTKRIVILLHGRGATAESMVSLAEAVEVDGTRFFIPQAASNRWYPQTAFGPLEVNEPDLTSALDLVGDLIEKAEKEGFDHSNIFLGGFSQGACLAAEYLVRNPVRKGGLFILSGALIGPPAQPRHPVGDLQGTPVFIGGSDVDPWVEASLFEEAARVFTELDAQVDLEIYPGTGHTVNMEEIKKIRGILSINGIN
jgi:predicted esterase